MGNPLTNRKCEGMKSKIVLAWTILLALLLCSHAAPAQDKGKQEVKKRIYQDVKERVFIVHEYRYEPGGTTENREIGLSLCGTRCNALSDRFANYIKTGGWRLIRTEHNKELAVDLDNPFLDGQCICVGDEYEVDFFDPVAPEERPGANEWQAVGERTLPTAPK